MGRNDAVDDWIIDTPNKIVPAHYAHTLTTLREGGAVHQQAGDVVVSLRPARGRAQDAPSER